MILSQLKQYLVRAKVANVLALAKRFQTEPEIVQDMLAIWERKGKVRIAPMNSACGSRCQKCPPEATMMYQWIG